MNRREFIRSLIAVPLAVHISPSQIPRPGTWGAITRSTTPMWRASYSAGTRPLTAQMVLKIPYHKYNMSRGQWIHQLEGVIQPDLLEMIQLLESDRK